MAQEFTDSPLTREELEQFTDAQLPEEPKSTSGALTMKAVTSGVPAASRLAMNVATSPNVPKVAAAIGRTIGGMAPAVTGLASGNPLAAVNGMLGASQGAWAGGKTGWFTGKLGQKMAAPVARILDQIAPYAKAAEPLAGAQGVLDLAQMADPKRKDIGFLGVGTGDPGDPSHPALINALIARLAAAAHR